MGRGFRLDLQDTLEEEARPPLPGRQGSRGRRQSCLAASGNSSSVRRKQTREAADMCAEEMQDADPRLKQPRGKGDSRSELMEFTPSSADARSVHLHAWHVHWGPWGNRSQPERRGETKC